MPCEAIRLVIKITERISQESSQDDCLEYIYGLNRANLQCPMHTTEEYMSNKKAVQSELYTKGMGKSWKNNVFISTSRNRSVTYTYAEMLINGGMCKLHMGL